MEKFPLLRFAFDAIEMGGNMPCILNAANEVAVASFLRGDMKFTDMPVFVEKVMKATLFMPTVTLDDLIATNEEALAKAREIAG